MDSERRTTNPASSLLRYYHDCYEADNRRGTVWSIFHRDVENVIGFAGVEDILTGNFPRLGIDGEEGDELRKKAYLSRKEKDLLYCSLFLVGRAATGEEGTRPVCAPLVMHPATIVDAEDGHLYLVPDLAERRVNQRVLAAIDREGEEESLLAAIDALDEPTLSAEAIALVMKSIEALDDSIDTTLLFSYPQLLSLDELRTRWRSAESGDDAGLALVPAAAAALVKKSTETRGVLNELSQLASMPTLSAPLRLVLGDRVDDVASASSIGRGAVPAILNNAQRRVLDSAARHPLTLAIGPPGTGKSFTIASLAIEHIARGQSVLVASKMSHAVNVVGAKLAELGAEDAFVRVGRGRKLDAMKEALWRMLSGSSTVDADAARLTHDTKRLRELDKSLDKLERAIERRTELEVEWGAILSAGDGFLFSLRKRWIDWRRSRMEPLEAMHDRLVGLHDERVELVRSIVSESIAARRVTALGKHRSELAKLSSALRSRSGGRQEEIFERLDFDAVSSAFPIWLVELSDVSSVLPLRSELFDLAIIDEATQCDIASCLPILQRARRVVITGDPKQLRHLSFLSRARQAAILDKHGLEREGATHDYRDKSILHLVDERITDQERIVFLDEHYRSLPSIIGFSNDRFYDRCLRVMTERPGASSREALALEICDGEQGESGENDAEGRRIVEEIAKRVEAERGASVPSSIGALSPFRGQADALQEAISRRLSIEAIERHSILVGTAYTFQGEERDVMFISSAIDESSHPMRRRFIEQPDQFNVAITRARRSQTLCCSNGSIASTSDSLLGAYLRYIENLDPSAGPEPWNGEGGDAEAGELMREFREQGYTIWRDYTIANVTLDMVICRDGEPPIGVELVGWGNAKKPLSIERLLMLRRAGLRVRSIPYRRDGG